MGGAASRGGCILTTVDGHVGGGVPSTILSTFYLFATVRSKNFKTTMERSSPLYFSYS